MVQEVVEHVSDARHHLRQQPRRGDVLRALLHHPDVHRAQLQVAPQRLRCAQASRVRQVARTPDCGRGRAGLATLHRRRSRQRQPGILQPLLSHALRVQTQTHPRGQANSRVSGRTVLPHRHLALLALAARQASPPGCVGCQVLLLPDLRSMCQVECLSRCKPRILDKMQFVLQARACFAAALSSCSCAAAEPKELATCWQVRLIYTLQGRTAGRSSPPAAL